MIDPHTAAEIFAENLLSIPGITVEATQAGKTIDKSTNRLGQKSAYLRAGGTSTTGRRFYWYIRLSDHYAAGDISHISIVLPNAEKIDEAMAFIQKELLK